MLRSPALWALVAFELLVFVPVGAYLLWRFPAWSFMYLLEPGWLPMSPVYLAAVYPMVAIGTYVGCRRLLASGKLLATFGILAGAMLMTGALGFLGREQLGVLGSTAEFRADPAEMRDVTGSLLGWVGLAGILAVVISWAATLWRLMLLGRVARPVQATDSSQSMEQPEPKGRRTKKKAS